MQVGTFNWKDYQILTCINTLTNKKDEVRLAEKLIKVYNKHTTLGTQMTLANVGTEVKQFWRDIKETQDLIFNGTKPGGGGNQQGQGQGKKSKRSRKRDKRKPAVTDMVAAVTDKDMYCFKCGDKAHIVKDCTVQDLKCDIHPNSKSHNKIACYIYRKANNLPVRNKSPQDQSNGSNTSTFPLPEMVRTS